jgi:hypothetical protein
MMEITKQPPREIYLSQYMGSSISKDIRYKIVWRQYINRVGNLIGPGTFISQKAYYRRRGYSALMRARIFKMREEYKKRIRNGK